MKLTEFKLNDYADNIKNEVFFENDIILVKSTKEEYTISKITFDSFEVKGDSLYKYKIDCDSKDCTMKFILNCLDAGGKNILRYYLSESGEIRLSKKAASAYIETVIFSYSKFEGAIKSIDFEYAGEIKRKNTTLVAVHIDSDQDVETTVEENLRKALYGIDKASKVNPDLIVLTECFYNRRIWKPFTETSVKTESVPVRELRKKAAEYKCYIATSLMIEEDGKYYNRGILINREGDIAGTYDKVNITMGEREMGIVPGKEAKVFDTDFGKVAFAICWDLWFPGLLKEYYKKGARVLINPTAGYPDKQMRARAIDNGMYIVSPTIMSRVRTRIIDPLGDVISNAEVNGYAYATVDLEKRFEEYWLSVGDTYGEGRNIYINEENNYVYEE